MSKGQKMTGSPFQVESQSRKYAIEHENDDVALIKATSINCKYRGTSANHACLLENSGLKYCAPYKCKYYNKEFRMANRSCLECAYFFDKHCVKQKQNCTPSFETATFCCFYVCDSPRSPYRQIQRNLKIKQQRNLIQKHESSLAKSTKYIKQATRELHSKNISTEDAAYLTAKIESRKGKCQSLQKKIEEAKNLLNTMLGQ